MPPAFFSFALLVSCKTQILNDILFELMIYVPLKNLSVMSVRSSENKVPCSRYNTMHLPGRVAQSVRCLATDACLTADPGVASSIPARYHTFVETDHEIISTVILLPSADLFKKGCCQLQAKVCAQITG